MAFAPFGSLGAVEALTEQDDRRSRSGIVAVVGRWSEQVVDGLTVVRSDGASEAATAADAAARGAGLFGKPAESFVANVTAPAAFALGVLPSHTSFTAGTYRAQFNLVSGVSDQTAGLVFDLQPTGEYHFVRYNTREGNVALWRYADGKREVVARTTDKTQLALGTWHQISLTVTGTRIVGEVNGMRLEHDLQRRPEGRIGFWTKRDSVTMFRQIVVAPSR